MEWKNYINEIKEKNGLKDKDLSALVGEKERLIRSWSTGERIPRRLTKIGFESEIARLGLIT